MAGRTISPEKLDALRAEFDLGLPIREAALAVGVSKDAARKYYHQWGWVRPPSHRGPDIIYNTRLAPAQKQRLAQEARRRNDSLSNFVGTLLDVIIAENLFRAILDE